MLAANEKDETIFAEHRQETFEFCEPSQLPDGRLVSNVRNNSHEEPGKHVYPVFFAVDDNAGGDIRAVECGCPADEFHDGPCKHRQAASDCRELLGCVNGIVNCDGSPIADIERVRDDNGVEYRVEENTEDIVWLQRGDPIKEDIWFIGRETFIDALDDKYETVALSPEPEVGQ